MKVYERTGWKKLVWILVLAIVITSVPVSFVEKADASTSYTFGPNVTGVLDGDTLTISGTGNIYHNGHTNSPIYSVRESIKNIVIKSGVTSIGHYTFQHCNNLASITIPDSVTSIGYMAFQDTYKLSSITLLGNANTTIDSTAFTNAGRDVTPKYAYAYPANTNAISAVKSAGYTVHEIQKFTFGPSVTGVLVGDTLTISGTGAMTDFVTDVDHGIIAPSTPLDVRDSIKNIIIENGITSIGSGIFFNMPNLTSVVIPEGITSIGAYAFSACTSLTSVTIPNSVERIGFGAFIGTNSLSEITFLRSENTDISNAFMGGGVSPKYAYANPANTNFIAAVTAAGYVLNPQFFTFGPSVTGVLAGGTLTISGTGAMTDFTPGSSPIYNVRTTIKNVIISGGVTSIGGSVFYDCTNLTSITIPNGVTSIGNYAFQNAYNLSEITFLRTGVTTIGSGAFLNAGRDVTPKYAYAYPTNTNFISTITSAGYTVAQKFTFGPSVTGVLVGDTLTISGTGAMTDFASMGSPIYSVRTTIKNVIIESGVTSIGSYAFANCTSLTSVAIPESVVSIGSYAFRICSSLTSVAIPESVVSIGSYAFRDCKNLTSVTIPNSVTSIGGYAFANCTSLTSVTIPESVISIGEHAFYGCTSLTSVTIPNSVNIGSGAFYGCTSLTSITIPEGVTSIGDSAFRECTGLTSVTIPEGVTSIRSYAFYGCTSLTSVTIPNSVTSIDNSAFRNAYNLSEITFLRTGVTTIGASAFTNAGRDVSLKYAYADTANTDFVASVTAAGYTVAQKYTFGPSVTGVLVGDTLTISGTGAMTDFGPGGSPIYSIRENINNVIIESGVTSIGNNAFSSCNNLTSVTIPNSVTSIGANAFFNCIRLAYITIPNSVTSIGDGAFSACNNLTSVVIPDGVISIGQSAFSMCANLTSVAIPNSVTSIGSSAFASCTRLTSIVIPSSIISIGGRAFSNTYNLAEITFLRSENTTIGSGAFTNAGRDVSPKYAYTYPSNIDFVTAVTTAGYTVAQKYTFGPSVTGVLVGDTLTISGTGAMTDFDYSGSPVYNNSAVKSVIINSGVTSIGNNAFRGCTGLILVAIPEGVTSVGNGSFYYCNSLTSVVIPEGVVSIGSFAFQYCTALTSVTMPDSVASIADYAFDSCTSLTSVVIPEGVTSIGSNAFRDCIGMTSLALPVGLITIGLGAFWGCTGLTAVTIPETVTTVGAGAFSGCTNLKAVTLPGAMSSVGKYVFRYCYLLEEIVYPYNGNSSIGLDAFLDAGRDVTPKCAYAYAANTNFITAITSSGYSIDTGEIALSASPNSGWTSGVLITAEYGKYTTSVEHSTDGSTWTPYTAPVTVTQNGTISFRGLYFETNVEASYNVSNIDTTAPVITITPVTTDPVAVMSIAVEITDAGGIAVRKFASGDRTAAYFQTSGNVFTENSITFDDLIENGVYTVYAKDTAGNEAVQKITISNIDRIIRVTHPINAIWEYDPNTDSVSTTGIDITNNSVFGVDGYLDVEQIDEPGMFQIDHGTQSWLSEQPVLIWNELSTTAGLAELILELAFVEGSNTYQSGINRDGIALDFYMDVADLPSMSSYPIFRLDKNSSVTHIVRPMKDSEGGAYLVGKNWDKTYMFKHKLIFTFSMSDPNKPFRGGGSGDPIIPGDPV